MKRVILSLLVLSSFVFAIQGNHKSELSATVGGVKPEGNLDLANQLNLGLRYGVYLDSLPYFDMLEGGFERASSVDYDNLTEDTNINRFFIDLVKEYDISKKTAIYGLIGLGYEDYTNPKLGNDDDGFAQYGLGVKQWITDKFALKAEVRHGITFGGDNNLFYNVGFVIPFGKTQKKVMPIKSEPVVEKKIAKKIEPAPKKPVVKKEKPKPVVVVPKDDDNDGVINENDLCLNTPAGRVVEKNGCMKVITLRLNFAYDKYDIASKYSAILKETADFMKKNSDYTVVLAGHTDSRGSMKYNQKLSEKRAEAVAKALVKLGVHRYRISTRGYGETKPIFSNDTKEGRAGNRRVEAVFNR